MSSFICPLCLTNQDFVSLAKMFPHVTLYHQNESDFEITCDLHGTCGALYRTYAAYKSHIYRQPLFGFHLPEKTTTTTTTSMLFLITNSDDNNASDFANDDPESLSTKDDYETIFYNPVSSFSSISDYYSSASSSSQKQNKKAIKFDQLKHTLNDICNAIESITKNEYQFIKHYETYFSYSSPEEITVSSPGEVSERGYFIPIDKTLFSILNSQPFILKILKNIEQQRITTEYDAGLMFAIKKIVLDQNVINIKCA
ncbi:unnamed protein product [Rotaria sordida]|uniref:Uncharacterized protein n=1 Tax=Rotaria sordida TaxID=392033 RepID=A0A819ANP3_9BILA|nr:unnamed protein product [Rotaria sordida]CAF3787707.1 unnamed protein product [Rotaria sordida]CAF4005456.1 unnamed protein product [Rotaria sordida]